MKLTTTEAAAQLAERGVLVKGRGTDPHPPTARTVEAWCRSGALVCQHIGSGKRGFWLIDSTALETFIVPTMGRKKE